MPQDTRADGPPAAPDDQPSADLLARAQAGDRAALDILFERYLVPLRRWASGRLPRWARDIADTQDVVQDTLLQTFKRVEFLEHGQSGSLQAYLRQAVMNRIRDEFRRSRRQPGREPVDSGLPAVDASPLEEAIGTEIMTTYEEALDRLRPDEREAVVGRIEMGLSYDELADVLERPTANAARSAVVRALVRLAEEMGRG